MKIRIKNKKRFTIVLSIVLVLLAMISGTYSLFYRESTASRKEDYTTGILSIVAKSKSDNINLTNALPMSDEEGVLTDPYVFTIENTGNLDYNFKIRLLSTSDNPINPDYIKLKIDDGEVTTLSSLTNSVIKDNITLKAKEVMDVSIRIWLASDTPNTEIGKSFNSRIVTEGQAVYTQMNNEDGTLSNSEHYISNLVQHIDNLYNTAEKTVVTADAERKCVNPSATGGCNGYTVTKTIDYNYATSVNLMNDRLGGTTTSLDGGNIRYYGASAKNYIDIGDRKLNNEVILWRIIGIFDGKVRVVRDESIGDYSWDTSASAVNSGYGINEWSQADLMKLLNPGFENNQDLNDAGETITVNNSLWWNHQSGTCYNDSNNGTKQCNFTSIGLSDSVKNKIVDQTIYLGGFESNDFASFSNHYYNLERGNKMVQNPDDGITRTLSWTGKVGLMYPSDIAYARDLNKCNYINTWMNCYKDSYLYNLNESTWYVTPNSGGADDVWGALSSGGVSVINAYSARGVRPVLTLDSEAVIESGGDGSSTNPYVLK